VKIPIGVAALEGLVLTVLTHLNNGEVDDAVTRFAEEFSLKDHGIGLEFKDKERLREFFQKIRELYPHSFSQTDTILVSGDHVITEWTLQATLMEPFYAALSRKVRILLHGASIVRTDCVPAHSLGFVFHGMGRTLNGGACCRTRVSTNNVKRNRKKSRDAAVRSGSEAAVTRELR
jgi:hypothetical protein